MQREVRRPCRPGLGGETDLMRVQEWGKLEDWNQSVENWVGETRPCQPRRMGLEQDA